MAYKELTYANLLRWTGGEWFGDTAWLHRQLSRISSDSRTVQPDDLFVALAGEKYDGHDFVLPHLAAKGTVAMVSRQWFQQHAAELTTASLVVVPDTLKALQTAASAYRDTFNLPCVAVTGSVGKTTTKEAIASVLSQKYRVLRNTKSFNNHIGVPLTLFELRDEHQILLTELGTNHFGELDTLGALVKPDMAMITNIGYAHLQYFQDLQGVARAKFEIFNHCRQNGLAIFNADDSILRSRSYPLPRTFSYALHHPADLNAEIAGCDDQARYTLRLQGREVTLPVSGRHNLYNALAAAAVGLQFGMGMDEILAGLASMQAMEKRMNLRSCAQVVVMDDTYNSNPTSCEAALRTLAEISVAGKGRRIAVLADMLELGSYSVQEHRKLADLAAELKLDRLLLYGRETQATLERAHELSLPVAHFTEKTLLHSALSGFVRAGDVLLVKGSRGMQMETVVEGICHFLANNPN